MVCCGCSAYIRIHPTQKEQEKERGNKNNFTLDPDESCRANREPFSRQEGTGGDEQGRAEMSPLTPFRGSILCAVNGGRGRRAATPLSGEQRRRTRVTLMRPSGKPGIQTDALLPIGADQMQDTDPGYTDTRTGIGEYSPLAGLNRFFVTAWHQRRRADQRPCRL
jgi:hypothetical protein